MDIKFDDYKRNKIFEETTFNRSAYLSWKRKNVTIRGVKNASAAEEENGAGAMLGDGLYTAALGNRVLAKKYGTVYFILNGIPKNPKVFNTLNDWEIWFYKELVTKHTDKDYPDQRDFFKVTNIKDAMLELGLINC